MLYLIRMMESTSSAVTGDRYLACGHLSSFFSLLMSLQRNAEQVKLRLSSELSCLCVYAILRIDDFKSIYGRHAFLQESYQSEEISS
jgi:hypothetical protein